MYPSVHGGGQGLYSRPNAGAAAQQQFYSNMEGPGEA